INVNVEGIDARHVADRDVNFRNLVAEGGYELVGGGKALANGSRAGNRPSGAAVVDIGSGPQVAVDGKEIAGCRRCGGKSQHADQYSDSRVHGDTSLTWNHSNSRTLYTR